MSFFKRAWILAERRDRRTRAVLVAALAALVFGLGLQSARACVSVVNTSGAVAQASAYPEAAGNGTGHCHHDEDGAFDACVVHCEQDGQTARANLETGVDDLRLAVVASPGAFAAGSTLRPARDPVSGIRPPELPAYLLLHRLNR